MCCPESYRGIWRAEELHLLLHLNLGKTSLSNLGGHNKDNQKIIRKITMAIMKKDFF